MGKEDSEELSGNETFVIDIRHSQNSSWQGEITWVTGENEKLHFRSGLELIKIIDTALEKKKSEEP